MKRLHTSALTALVLVFGLSATAADAQVLRGFRAEADGGVSSFHSEGNHKSKIGWGGEAGVDFDLGGFVLGAEGTFWWAPAENKTIDGPGLAEHKTFQEYALAARLGFQVTPSTLVYGKVGYAWNEQRKRFTPFAPGTTLLDSAQPGAYYHHFTAHGIQWGGGVEQQVSGPFYVKAEGRYSDYNDDTHTLTGLVGIGVLLGGATAEALPPPPPPAPPPPPPPPATQTCPDGSTILATDTCPPPPPPPPPPPAPVERGERG